MGGFSDITGLAATVAVCVFALIFGGLRERRGAALCLAWRVIIAGAMLARLDVTWTHLCADVLCLAGFVILGWKAPHPWPLWAGGCEMAAVTIGINRLCGYPTAPSAYAILGSLCICGVVISLAFGTVGAIRHRRE